MPPARGTCGKCKLPAPLLDRMTHTCNGNASEFTKSRRNAAQHRWRGANGHGPTVCARMNSPERWPKIECGTASVERKSFISRQTSCQQTVHPPITPLTGACQMVWTCRRPAEAGKRHERLSARDRSDGGTQPPASLNETSTLYTAAGGGTQGDTKLHECSNMH